MNKILSVSLVLAVIVSLSACTKIKGEGPVVIETRQITDFSAVRTEVSGDLYYRQANEFKVEIRAQRNILDLIRTTVENGELRIKFKDNTNIRKHDPIEIHVSSPDISGLRISGSANIHSTNINTDNLHLSVSGSGNIDLPVLQANSLDARISGSGNITVLGGTLDDATLEISGSGNLEMQDLQVTEASTRTSGSGNIRTKVVSKLDVFIAGSGSVFYKGNPLLSVNISGSGRVIHVN